MTENYIFKTDRERQWALLEHDNLNQGVSRDTIEEMKTFFFDGEGDRWRSYPNLANLLARWPKRGVAGWQEYFDHHRKKPLSKAEIFTLQAGVLTGFYGSHQHPEDDAYYVRTLFGETWNPDTKIKLNLVTEEPLEPLNPNIAFACGGSNLTSWLEEDEGEHSRGGYMRFMPEFFRSLISYIDGRTFDLNKYPFRQKISDEVPVGVSSLKTVVSSVILSAQKIETGNPFYDERILVAKQFYAMFEEMRNDLEGFSQFEAKTLAEADEE